MKEEDRILEEMYKTKTIANYVAVLFVVFLSFIAGLLLF